MISNMPIVARLSSSLLMSMFSGSAVQNPFNINSDKMQPMQYSRQPTGIGSNQSCATCHTIDMEFSVHHENMQGMFRNTSLIQ